MSSEIHQKTFEDHYYESERLNGEARKELTKLRATLDESIKVIEFYGSQSSWMGYHRDVDIIASSDCSPAKSIEDDFDIMLGGRRAREFLSKHSELIKGEV
jgi:hypothetical protein